jgi:hypothetical protein
MQMTETCKINKIDNYFFWTETTLEYNMQDKNSLTEYKKKKGHKSKLGWVNIFDVMILLKLWDVILFMTMSIPQQIIHTFPGS